VLYMLCCKLHIADALNYLQQKKSTNNLLGIG
jgi:hypothetical protein